MYVVVYSGDGSGHLSCTCPDCAFDNYKEVDDRTVELLVISGMKRVASTVPRIKPDVYLDEVNDFSKVPEADLFRRITEGDPST